MKKIYLLLFICPCVFNVSYAIDVKSFLYVDSDAYGCKNKDIKNTCFKIKGKLRGVWPTDEQDKNKIWLKNDWFNVKTKTEFGDNWWIESKYLEQSESFVKVKNKWPVRFLIYDTENGVMVTKFTPTGSAEIKIGYKKYTGHVYLGKKGKLQRTEIRYPSPTNHKILDSLVLDTKTGLFIQPCTPGELCEQARFTDKRKPIYITPEDTRDCLIDCS